MARVERDFRYRSFDSSGIQAVGLYVMHYESEGICKIGVTSDLPERLTNLRAATWVDVTPTSFFFPFKPSRDIAHTKDDYSITRVSAYALEKLCHQKLKELELHLRGEFFEIFPDDADQLVRKVAEVEGFRLVAPIDILALDLDTIVRQDEKAAFLDLASAATRALQGMGVDAS